MILPNSIVFALFGMMIALFALPSFRKKFSAWFFATKERLWLFPAIALLSYSGVAATTGRWQLREFALLAVYFCYPVAVFWMLRSRDVKASLLDAIVVLAVWFPLEFELIDPRWTRISGLPIPVGVFATVILLFVLLTNDERFDLHVPGILKGGELLSVGIAYVLLFAIIVPIGTQVDFVALGLNHRLLSHPWNPVLLFPVIFFTVAVPEELLFRGWIQNLLMTRLKFLPGLLSAGVIFGLSHLDNRVVTSTHSFGLPNWWYAFFATLAGCAYGTIYHKRKSLFASALLHTLVDFTWVMFFAG